MSERQERGKKESECVVISALRAMFFPPKAAKAENIPAHFSTA
jgi:hypothetical protein